MTSTAEVVIVGAGLAGLCCARRLAGAGISTVVLEASDGVGGRVRTDSAEGFLLDRGFQVLLTAYPEARTVLDYDALDLRPFYPGVLVRFDGAFHRIADPWRKPVDALRSLGGPIGSLGDKLRVAGLRSRALAGTLDDVLARPETTAIEALRRRGFSDSMIDRFFRPFLGGVFLDRSLCTSSRMLDFVIRMFALGDNALPARGMGEITRQIAERLPVGTIRTGTRAASVEPGAVVLTSGERLTARAVVVATEGPAAADLVPEVPAPASLPVTCLYFAAPAAPVLEPILVLNGDGTGPVNNLAVPSQIAPAYAPPGQSLVSATVLEPGSRNERELEADVRRQLSEWFGVLVDEWRHLRTLHIAHALAALPPGTRRETPSPRLGSGIFIAGDYLTTPSIQGAMLSGRRTAEAVLCALAR